MLQNLKLLFNFPLPILGGPLKGTRWFWGSGGTSYLLGTYEREACNVFQNLMKKGNVVFDIGAHVGFYTLFSAKCVGQEGAVYAFEPLDRNVGFLKKHVRLNKCKNVIILGVAVSDKDGFVYFEKGKDNFQGRVVSGGGTKVFSVTLDHVVFHKNFSPPDVLKIDVEGGEYAVLRGGMGVLKTYRPHILLSTHGEELRRSCLLLLKKADYESERIGPNEFVARPLKGAV